MTRESERIMSASPIPKLCWPHRLRRQETQGFTLVEILVVLAILAVLAAILFPTFAAVRGNARRTVCLSNLRQIGLAIHAYTQDNDDRLPYGVDICDKYTNGWANTPFQRRVRHMPLLPDLLLPYTTTKALWRCPSDSVQTFCGPASSGPSRVPARFHSFDARGMSYIYHTELTLRNLPLSSLTLYDAAPPHTSHGPSEILLLSDADGQWHGGGLFSPPRYNVLMADGHMQSLEEDKAGLLWGQVVTSP